MAVNLNCFSEGFPDDVELALVIAGSSVTGSKEQRHAGFVVKDGGGQLWLFDLAWHDLFRKVPVTAEYAYSIVEFIDPYAANAIIAFLVMLHNDSAGRISYSINYEDGDYFDKATAEQLKNGRGQGLTCATLVLEVLKRHGFELIDRRSWPLTEENKGWQISTIDKLSRTRPASIDNFLAQVEFIGKVPRIRPEEAIGAAGVFDDAPLRYDDVLPESIEVVKALERIGLL